MKVHMKHLLTACLIFATTSIHAEPGPEALKLGNRLSQLLGTEDMFSAYLKQCTAPNSGYDPKYIFRNDPSHFGGISPQSAYWPEIEQLFHKYQERMCGYITAEEFSQFFAKNYAGYLSVAELKSAIAYYSTPGGQKVRTANVKANEAFQKYAQDRISELYKKTYAEVSNEIVEVIRKYKKDPR